MDDFDFEINQGQNIEFDIIESSYATNAYADTKISEHNADLNAHVELMKLKSDKSNSLGGFEGGEDASAGMGVAAGYQTRTGNGVAIGYLAKTVGSLNSPIDAVQIGTGTNHDEGTFQVYSYKMLDENGTIPSERLPQSVIPKTATVIVNTPAWTNQPTIEGDLNPAFVDWTHRPYWVVLKDTSGSALPENQFKLTETKDDYANAIDQIFTLPGLDTGNNGAVSENSVVDFKEISGNIFTMRNGGVSNVNSPAELGTYDKVRFSINGNAMMHYIAITTGIPAAQRTNAMVFGAYPSVSGYWLSYIGGSGNLSFVIFSAEVEKTNGKVVLKINFSYKYGENRFINGSDINNYSGYAVVFDSPGNDGFVESIPMKISVLEYSSPYTTYLNGTEITWEVFE